MDVQAFWQRVKTLSKTNKLTLVELSESLDFNSKYISILISRNTIPDIQLAETLADKLHVSIQYLITGEEDFPLQTIELAKEISELSVDKQLFIKQALNFLKH